MRSVQIYVENRKLELFSDEKIVVNSSVQNIADISKVFTDFSQTFTIPCTPVNNYIFEHYYNNDVDNTIDHRNRREARIEINYIPFRTGKIQLEQGTIKNGRPENYQVTFYGDVVTLKDLLGEDKLNALDYATVNHDYDGSEVQDRIEIAPSTTDYDVRYPLISSSRVWRYGDASSNDISVTGTAMEYTELFPAVRVKSIFDLIESQYGVTFTGSFLDSKRFTNLFLWFKNRESFSFISPPKAVKFGLGNPTTDFLYNDYANVKYVSPFTLLTGSYTNVTSITHTLNVEIQTGSSVDYFLDVYRDGVNISNLLGNGTTMFTIVTNSPNYVSMNYLYRFNVRSVSSMSFSATVTYDLKYTQVEMSGGVIVASANFTDTYTENTPTSVTTDAKTDLQFLAPDMKITDFLSGIMNVFNMTCYATGSSTFRIEPLENFYNNGIEWNLTEYVITDEITVQRPKLYKNVSFEWEQSQNFLSREFYDLFKREYGNLKAAFTYDGGDYAIKVPFETILGETYTGADLHVQYCLGTEPEYKNYIPKPTLLYMYEQTTSSGFEFDNGTTVATITDYMPFGQDVLFNQNESTLNFGSEFSTITLNVEDNSLYRNYYEPYLLNLFDPKTRIVNIKTILPLSVLTNLKLNASVIVRDKKYTINEMSSDLTTGEVSFSLLSSWRDTLDYSRFFLVDNTNSTLYVPYSVADDTTVTIGLPFETQFATPSDYTPIGEQIITLTILSNGTAAERTNTFPVTIVSGGVTLPTQYIIVVQQA
jgi:hypothetical protein